MVVEVRFEQVIAEEQISVLCRLAKCIWHQTYDSILPEGQTEYMIEKFQSEPAVKHQIEQENYRYYLIVYKRENVGFLGISPEHKNAGELFLSKLYLLSTFQGCGIAKQAFRFIEKTAKDLRLGKIRLTVNKRNLHAKEVYTHYGFQIVESVVSDIGSGYAMDDYVMVKSC